MVRALIVACFAGVQIPRLPLSICLGCHAGWLAGSSMPIRRQREREGEREGERKGEREESEFQFSTLGTMPPPPLPPWPPSPLLSSSPRDKIYFLRNCVRPRGAASERSPIIRIHPFIFLVWQDLPLFSSREIPPNSCRCPILRPSGICLPIVKMPPHLPLDPPFLSALPSLPPPLLPSASIGRLAVASAFLPPSLSLPSSLATLRHEYKNEAREGGREGGSA